MLYPVADGNFTPLLGCDACLHMEVLEFTNLELILRSPCRPFPSPCRSIQFGDVSEAN